MQIQELTLYTVQLEPLLRFYVEELELKLIEQQAKLARIQVGSTILRFEEKKQATPYHFAINIPSNQEEEALQWLKTKVSILTHEENEIQEFKDWNAKAIYFYDPDNNIVEFIARKNLKNHSDQPFSRNSLLNISEIGLGCNSLKKQYDFLNTHTGLSIYDGNFNRFCAMGDENGLFIGVDYSVKDWFPTGDKVEASDFRIDFIEQKNLFQLSYHDEKLNLH